MVYTSINMYSLVEAGLSRNGFVMYDFSLSEVTSHSDGSGVRVTTLLHIFPVNLKIARTLHKEKIKEAPQTRYCFSKGMYN